MLRIVVLDDYQDVALRMADWTPLDGRAEVTTVREHLADEDELVARLADAEVVVAMRERTPLPRRVLDRLPRLRLIVTTGLRNASIDVDAARERGIPVSGTRSLGSGPVELTWALVLGLLRHVETEAAGMRAGRWQTTVGGDLAGHTLGLIGLGRIGSAVARVGTAFGMDVLAWSANLTPESAAAAGATWTPYEELLERSDVVSVHLVLSERTHGLVGREALARMRPHALLINTSRGPIVDTDALVEALTEGRIGGAGLDVYDEEPLPADHPLRTAPRTLLTPHLGYVTKDVYRVFFADVVEDVLAFLDGEPVRTL